jgi:glycosyltransferase involved in cell wall biosynthesis
MEDLIVGSTRGLLNLRYPQMEVIVVEDGSTDATFTRLEEQWPSSCSSSAGRRAS